MVKCEIGCLICGKELDNLQGDDGNQPIGGIEFTTQGHYGSTVFDPMDGSFLIINLCDECADNAIKNNRTIRTK